MPSKRHHSRTKLLLGMAVLFLLVGAACQSMGPAATVGSDTAHQGVPDCGFSPCPVTTDATSATVSDPENGTTFQYPLHIPTTYISTVDWPPKLQTVSTAYGCMPGGAVDSRAGMTEERVYMGRQYCVTQVREGAAGSTYTQYAYAFAKDGGTAILTFSLRSVQCANYDEPQKSTCSEEQASYDVDQLADGVAQSLVITQ